MTTHAARLASRDGYFAPESRLRRIGSSPLVPLLGAGPAVLFQVAHPLVAASVAAHSDYRRDLWTRWLRTVRALYLITFGTRAEAEEAGAAVRESHARIRGRTTAPLGVHPAGTEYCAADPALMFWVHATLIEVALGVYGRLVSPLAPEDEEAYYRDMAVVAELVGIPRAVVPPTLGEFRELVASLLAGPVIAVTPTAHDIADAVLDAALPLPLRGLRPVHRLATAGLLPAPLRAQYGLAWGPGRAGALVLAAVSLRAVTWPVLLAAARVPPVALELAAAPLLGGGSAWTSRA